jgi:Uma2 family endonuclease
MAIVSKTRNRFTTRLGLRSSGTLMTPEEFDDLPDYVFTKGLRYELINGVLIVTPPPGNGEVAPNSELGHLVWYYKHYHPQGSIVDEVLAEQTIHATTLRRRADHAIWTGLGHVPDVEKDIPSIVVEFVSQSRRDHKRDYEEKRAEYLAIGVREYWIIDRFQRIMTVYLDRPEGVASLVVKEAEAYQTDLLPGFTLPLARLLARADDWPRKSRKPRRKPLEGDPH